MKALALISLIAAPAFAGEVTVVVRGAAPGEGRALISVFTDAETWMKGPAGRADVAIDGRGEAHAVIAAPDAPLVAVAVIWDRDGDGALTTNLLGIPTEPFGFSNDATAFFGPPHWADAATAYGATAEVVVTLTEAQR